MNAYRDLTSHITADPGLARLAQVRAHWAVCDDTARAILAAHGLAPAGPGVARYRWGDIWRIEGTPWAPADEWPALRAPLLPPADLPGLDPLGRSARTWRRHLATGALPSIRLSASVRRVRPEIFRRAVLHV